MFKMKKLGAVAASLAFAGALALTGCGNSDAPADAAGSADASGSDTMQLVTDGTLTIGTSAEYEPFEYMEDGEYKGFDLELAQAIADDLGLELKIENVDFDTIVPGVASGTKYDMGIAAITATPEREKEVGFTDSYYMDDQAIVTMADNTGITGDNYADALNAEGVKIAVQSGSTAEAFAKENFPNAELVPFKNATDCFAAVQSSQANALVTNRSVAAQLVATSFSNEQVIKQISTGEEYAIAVNKDNTALLDALNDSIAKLTEDGTVDELMTKYNIK
ncbi:amino acid ABC transporter substrate-binding protein [Collinsella tanakaei]|uniref:Amino acid ABC transporter substrate-binding protein n=1 Tax=Collinsella tanakaei TaxID=626935 RepID=A0A3E4QWW0_9ACTN|nr:ABC transporter substrate-binding protein [Collinsella tanakaei]RGL11726.1 amino acid ABC transporter substrate-binding protein [Collinsella tanakaei]